MKKGVVTFPFFIISAEYQKSRRKSYPFLFSLCVT